MASTQMQAAIETFGLGRIPSEDERDKQYTMRRLLSEMSDAQMRGWRYYQAEPAMDQGTTPQCVGYAWRQWLSSAPLMTKDGPQAAQIYKAAQEVDEWPGTNYEGTSVRAGIKVLRAYGHVANYYWAWDLDTVVEWMLSGQGTVIVGTNWYLSMFYPDNGGIIKVSGPVVGGHAYMLVGCNRRRKKFRILNSWGQSWGEGGRAWISFDDMARLIAEDGEACAAVEQKKA